MRQHLPDAQACLTTLPPLGPSSGGGGGGTCTQGWQPGRCVHNHNLEQRRLRRVVHALQLLRRGEVRAARRAEIERRGNIRPPAGVEAAQSRVHRRGGVAVVLLLRARSEGGLTQQRLAPRSGLRPAGPGPPPQLQGAAPRRGLPPRAGCATRAR